MKRNKVKKIKIMTLVICMLLIVTSFSSAAVTLSDTSIVTKNEDEIDDFKESRPELAKNTETQPLVSDASDIKIENTIDMKDLRRQESLDDEIYHEVEHSDRFKEPQLESSEKTEVKLLASDLYGLTIENTINPDDLCIEPVLVDNEIYHKVALLDYVFTTEVGKPQLPIKSQLVALPESVDIDLEILSSEYTTKDGLNIFPVPEQVERETPDGYTYYDEVFSIDNVFYSADAFYPDKLVEIKSISHIRGLRVARIVFLPVWYNPVTQEVQVYSSIKVKIVYSHDAELKVKNVGPYDSICSNLVLNYASSKTTIEDQNKNRGTRQGNISYPSTLSDPNNSADYLIITSDYFYYPAKQDFENGTLDNRLNELAHWRAEYNGFDVAVVNVNDSSIGGNNDTKIKNFIEYVYNNWSAPHMSDNKIGYILLVGDTPFVISHIMPEHQNDYADDNWYGCIYEYSIPDIMIGRFSVDNQTELDVIANKTIQYEQNPAPGDWHKKVLMTRGGMPDLSDEISTWYSFIKEVLLELGGWEVFEEFYLEGTTHDDIVNDINEGRGIVVYMGHGRIEGWQSNDWIFDSDELNNGNKTPLVYSLACSTGRFQGFPGIPGAPDDDCMGELLLNTPDKGAVAFFGSSHLATPSCFLQGKFLFEMIFEEFEYIVGKIILGQAIQFGFYPASFNLLGDPALDLSGATGYSDRPDLAISHLDISINPEIPTTEDEEVFITANISNIGGSIAENVTVQFIIADYCGEQHIIGEHIVSEILPGTKSMLIQQWDISEEFFKKDLIVKIDPLDTIDEAYELNNQAGIQIMIIRTNFSNVTYVDDDYNSSTYGWGDDHFAHILEGIDAVAEHGTVAVNPGTYYEHVTIDKPLTLIGENSSNTIIDGNQIRNVVIISADSVTVRGFTIKNSSNCSKSKDWAGIKVYSDNNIIAGNKIINNNIGISVVKSYSNSISDNIIIDNHYGIKIPDTFRNIINDNAICYNLVSGIKVENSCPWSEGNTIYGNNISYNGHGIVLDKWAWNNIIKNNFIVKNNLCGIYANSSTNNSIIYNNNFINNTQYNAYDKGDNTWDNNISVGNYWSDFEENPGYPGFYIIQGKIPSSHDRYPLPSEIIIFADAYGPYAGEVNVPVQFMGSASSGMLPYTEWLWDFGDGNTSDQQNTTLMT